MQKIKLKKYIQGESRKKIKSAGVLGFDRAFKITVMVGTEPGSYHVQWIRISSTGFSTTMTIKDTISRDIWTRSYFAVDPRWYLGVGTFLTVINWEVMWLCKSEVRENFFWIQNKVGKVKRHSNDIYFVSLSNQTNNLSKVMILLQFSQKERTSYFE